MFDLKGQIVAITGASSGIGEAAGRFLAAQGAEVLLGARRVNNLQAIAMDIREASGDVEFQAVDVSKRDEVASFVKKAQQSFGRLDVLISNAGLMPLSPLDDLKVDEWDRMIDVNIKGVLYDIAAALPLFRKQGSGHLINVSSVAGHRVAPTGAVYWIETGSRRQNQSDDHFTGRRGVGAGRNDQQSRGEKAHPGLSQGRNSRRGDRLSHGLRHCSAARGRRQ
jgi:NADP-dependent 3-hydroxy acid dehydrogenase YdfG